MAINLEGIGKKALVEACKSAGMRKDWARVSESECASLLSAMHSEGDDQRVAVRNALYAHTPLGWSNIDQREGQAIDQRAPINVIAKGDVQDDKPANESTGDTKDDDKGEQPANASGYGEAKDGPGSTLARIIRDSEREAGTQAATQGWHNVGELHAPLNEAITQFAGQIVEQSVESMTEELVPHLQSLRDGMKERSESIEKLSATVKQIIKDAKENAVTAVQIQRTDDVTVTLAGNHHAQFADLLRTLSCTLPDGHHLNVWLVGPAGSGKTHACIQAAEALGLTYYSNGSFCTKHEALGYNHAMGGYVPTAFRNAWENGGLFVADEIDGSVPNAVVGINQALSTPLFTFPDKTVPRHKDFVFVGCANTYGVGGNDYVGRFRQDESSRDRFVFIDWKIDEKLERALSTNKDWTARVQSFRKRAIDNGLKVLITPRASIYGCALLKAGFDRDAVDRMTIRKGMSDDQWTAIGGAA